MKIFIIVICLLSPLYNFSQIESLQTSKNLSIQGIYQNGYIFPTNDFLRGTNAESDTINTFQ